MKGKDRSTLRSMIRGRKDTYEVDGQSNMFSSDDGSRPLAHLSVIREKEGDKTADLSTMRQSSTRRKLFTRRGSGRKLSVTSKRNKRGLWLSDEGQELVSPQHT